MPIIQKRRKEVLKPVTVQMPEQLAAKLRAYADYANLSSSEIVATALEYVIASDKEFIHANENISAGTEAGKIKSKQLAASL